MRKTNSIKNFRMYCNSYECPEYIKRYIFRMNEEEFYNFFKEVNRAASYLIDEDYLLYKLFWILKYNFTDLSKELCDELCFNVEGYNLDKIISYDKLNELITLYHSYEEYF